MLTVEQLRDILREGAMLTHGDAWTLAERVHAALTAHPAPVERVPLSDEQIDAAIGKPLDDLLDHIYEYSTAAEGIKERARRIARAVITEYERVNGIGKGEQS